MTTTLVISSAGLTTWMERGMIRPPSDWLALGEVEEDSRCLHRSSHDQTGGRSSSSKTNILTPPNSFSSNSSTDKVVVVCWPGLLVCIPTTGFRKPLI